MTASIAKLSAGDGYTYLTRQTAVHDSTGLGRQELADYYTEKGERPGVWLGSGLAGVDGLAAGDAVTEAHMRALFGEGLNPLADDITASMIAVGASDKEIAKAIRLGRPFAQYPTSTPYLAALAEAYRQWNTDRGNPPAGPIPEESRALLRTEVATKVFTEAFGRAPIDGRELTGFITRESRPQQTAVAGFDITFSPVKSVSALWAVAPSRVAKRIEKAHDVAVAEAMRLLEAEVAFTRRGAQGVRHVETAGVMATAFTHRDSRAGDPDLHTHVAVSNKVQDKKDGTWLALDGQVLYQAVVRISERYNTALETELTRRLGVRFVERTDSQNRQTRPVREIAGVPDRLLTAWSTRRTLIDQRAAELAADFKQAHGRDPSVKERAKLFQTATLDTREAKHEPRSEAEQRRQWTADAQRILGDRGITRLLDQVRNRSRRRGLFAPGQRDTIAAAVAEQAITTVQTSRARWRDNHVAAEVDRLVRARNLHPGEVDRIAAKALERALQHPSVRRVSRVDPVVDPVELQRSDGTSVYVTPHSTLYTTTAVLAAEQAILQAASRTDGRQVSDMEVDLALLESTANGVDLNPGQAAMVRSLATSGARVQLVLAPAGSGKTTAMRTLASAWRSSGGTVLGVGPSATAASELGDALNVTTDTIASLTWRLTTGKPLPQWAVDVDERTLLVVDEAGMAATTDLAQIIGFVTARGGSVRLVGDDQQLASVAAGGILRDLATSCDHTVTLSQLLRFRDSAEAAATLGLRAGDVDVLGWYLDHDRVHHAPEGASLDQVFAGWQADTAAGMRSLMMAHSVADVTELNDRARAARVTAGAVTGPTVQLRTGLPAAEGDLIITRRNDRGHRTSSTDWVKNGDRWTVTAVNPDGHTGSLQARHVESGRVAWLSAAYVADAVDLGYACTIHTSQGCTVDITRTHLTGSETRQLLYVAASRGREANHLYVSTGTDGDPHGRVLPDQVLPNTPTEILESIIGRDGAQISAHTEIGRTEDPWLLLGRHTPIYTDTLHQAALNTCPPGTVERLTGGADAAVPGLSDEPAWESLLAHLILIEADGSDAVAALTAAAEDRELVTAHDKAAVLWWRLDAETGTKHGPLPWLPHTPTHLAGHPLWGPLLAARADQVIDAAGQLRDQITSLPANQLPPWAKHLTADRALMADLAVWRAAMNVPDHDHRPTGKPRGSHAERDAQQALERRVTGLLGRAGQRWRAQIVAREPRVVDDPFWLVLGRRLDDAAAVIGVPGLLEHALDQGPLPDDHPAAALWFRLAPTLAPSTALADSHLLRPDWVATLEQLLPVHTPRILADPGWTTLVSTIDQATRVTGATSDELLAAAIALTPVAVIDIDAYTTALTYRIADLAAHPHTPDDDEADAARHHTQPVDEAGGDESGEQVVTAADQHAYDTGDLVDRDGRPTASTFATAPTSTGPEPVLHVPAEPLDDTIGAPGEPIAAEIQSTSVTRILELNLQAADFYQQNYPGSGAARYITTRFGDDLSDMPGLVIGHAPARGLTDHLLAGGATPNELVDAGLALHSRHGGIYDRFRDRVMIGIHNPAGDLVGFIGRAAPGAAPNVPKYLNTPTTAAFVKGAVLFGLHEAPASPVGAPVVRVEGPLDAIAVTRASGGAAVGVAPLGTALTHVQAQLLTDSGVPILHGTDTDAAGRKAASADYQLLTRYGATPHQLILMPLDGDLRPIKDPAELYGRDNGHTLGRILDHPAAAPTMASTLIRDLITDHAPKLADNGALVPAALKQAAELMAPLPLDQWSDHVDLTIDLLLAVRPADVSYRHDLRDELMNEAVTASLTLSPAPTRAEPTGAERLRALITSNTPQAHDRLQALVERITNGSAHAPDAPTAPPSPGRDRDTPGRDLP